jgi:hypothetical protein
MSRDSASGERDAELAQLRALVLEQAASLAQLRVEVTDLRAGRSELSELPASHRSKRTKCTAETGRASASGQPTSRRGLLQRLGASVAGVAAASAYAAAQPERAAADYQGTSVGAGIANIGIMAYPSGVTPPVTVDLHGVVGVANSSAAGPIGNAGVWGTGNTSRGVVGTSNSFHGVHGRSTSTISTDAGVFGETTTTAAGEINSGVLGKAGTAADLTVGAGVTGTSAQLVGTQGLSTNNHGVFGRTSAAAGTVVGGLLAAGLAGRTSSTIALYGYADGPANPSFAPVGAVGQCESGFGVWGLSSAGPGATSRPGGGAVTAISGVLGTSTSGLGVYAISSGAYAFAADGKGPSTVGALIRGLGGAQAAVFVGNVEIQGHLSVSGGVNGPVGASTGLQTMEAREAVVEDFGEGRVERGTATIPLDPALVALVQGSAYQVFLTSHDDVHLHVATRTPQSFEVRVTSGTGRAADITAGRATAGFSYRVVARRRAGPGGQRADAAPLHVPTLPVPQGIPTLPVGPEPPPSDRDRDIRRGQ